MSGKAKESEVDTEEGLEEYFFPKFLTSRNLLELEVRRASLRPALKRMLTSPLAARRRQLPPSDPHPDAHPLSVPPQPHARRANTRPVFPPSQRRRALAVRPADGERDLDSRDAEPNARRAGCDGWRSTVPQGCSACTPARTELGASAFL